MVRWPGGEVSLPTIEALRTELALELTLVCVLGTLAVDQMY